MLSWVVAFRSTLRRSRKSHSHCGLHHPTPLVSPFSTRSRRSDAQFASRMGLRDVRTFRRANAPKSLPLNLFADPHPLTPVSSIFYKNIGGKGVPPTSEFAIRFPGKWVAPQLSHLESTLTDKHSVLPVFSRNSLVSSSLESTLVSPLVSVDFKRVTGNLSPLDATLTKNRGWGSYGPSWLRLHTGTLPRPISFVCRSYATFASRTLLRDENWRVCTQNSHSGRGCTPNIQTFNLQTFKRSSRPIAAKRLWCNNPQRRENSSRSGETSPLPSVSKTTRADIGSCSPTLPIASRAWVQRSNAKSVITLDRSAGWLAFQRRVGKAGSVRLG